MIDVTKLWGPLNALGFRKNIELNFWDTWDEWRFQQNIIAGPYATGFTASGTNSTNVTLLSKQIGFFNNGNACNSSASANSGPAFFTPAAAMAFGRIPQKCQFIWMPVDSTAFAGRFGFQDSVNTLAIVDGAWISIAGTTLTGKTSNNSTVSTTGTSFTLVADTPYVFDVTVNAGATLAEFKVYNALTEALVWSDSLATNIPQFDIARQFQVSAVPLKTTAGAVTMGNIYMMGHGTPKAYQKMKGRLK